MFHDLLAALGSATGTVLALIFVFLMAISRPGATEQQPIELGEPVDDSIEVDCLDVYELAEPVVAFVPDLNDVTCTIIGDSPGVCGSWSNILGPHGRVRIAERTLRGGCTTATAQWVIAHEYGHAWQFTVLEDPDLGIELVADPIDRYEVVADCFARLTVGPTSLRDRCIPEMFDLVAAEIQAGLLPNSPT